jgi:hypothetical protein
MKTPAVALAVSLLLSSCCSTGTDVSLHAYVEHTAGPLLVVYYPDHGTWNTPMMRTTVELDGKPVGKLCQGDVLAIPVTTGRHVLTTSRDDELGCEMALFRPDGGWPPVEIVVGDETIYVRYGMEPYAGPDTPASICERRLTPVDEITVRLEVDRLDLIGP